MSRLPRITAKQVISILDKHGFVLVRQSGSHKIFRNPMGKRTTVPVHDNRILHPKILRSIIKDAEIDIDELKF